MRQGIIAAVCIRAESGIPKYPQEKVIVAQYGFAGDYHCRETRPSFRDPAVIKPNERQITLVAEELLHDINHRLAMGLGPGAFSENITTRGLGDLSDIPDGARIRLNGEVILQVVEQNQPCNVLKEAYGENGVAVVRLSAHRRGLICIVESGIGGELRAGQHIEVL